MVLETFEVLNKKFGVGWNIVIGKAFHSEFQAVKGMFRKGLFIEPSKGITIDYIL